MKNIFFVLLLIVSISCHGQESIGVYAIDLQTLKAEVIGKDVQLVDVRSEKEYSQGHIDDAININIADKENFKTEIQKLDKTKPIYMYCHAGVRSRRASQLITELGFTRVYDFTGGWSAWRQQQE
ncbi:rhodanese-like domain-containing protein [uncultured Dokdonia sp.]|uniref:rhodanese-like domain-containing protein n=1 Tax=uncultured Dokdonia sp. TaxID=575653 RepID=UPI00260C901F|nr:rhodanese-like domain-containing protein [uncultured Dokdonia sp.]